MSEENVELVRHANEALVRRDRAAWLAACDEDIEVVPIPEWPEPGVRGAAASWDFYLKTFDAFERFPVDDAEILARQHHPARQARSGEWCADRAEALEAAGLSE
jgi:ketosteroid isomerase-like protein